MPIDPCPESPWTVTVSPGSRKGPPLNPAVKICRKGSEGTVQIPAMRLQGIGISPAMDTRKEVGSLPGRPMQVASMQGGRNPDLMSVFQSLQSGKYVADTRRQGEFFGPVPRVEDATRRMPTDLGLPPIGWNVPVFPRSSKSDFPATPHGPWKESICQIDSASSSEPGFS